MESLLQEEWHITGTRISDKSSADVYYGDRTVRIPREVMISYFLADPYEMFWLEKEDRETWPWKLPEEKRKKKLSEMERTAVMESFLNDQADIVFALKEQTRQVAGIQVHDLFQSRIYLIARRDDPLAEKNLIREEDLYGRTLMVGGGSPQALKAVQHRLISSGKVGYFNSADHETTRTYVAAGKGICLAPGFLNDHSGQFAWIPFDCRESFSCVLCTHKTDQRRSLKEFLAILKKLYSDAVAFPL